MNKLQKISLIGNQNDNFKNAISSIIEPSDSNVILYDVSHMEVFKSNEDAYNTLATLINSKMRNYSHMASILNAIFTQKTDCFIISKKILTKLVKNDKNHDFNTMHGTYYKAVMNNLTKADLPIITVIKPPIKEEGKAGFYRINKQHPIYNILKDLVSEEFLETSFRAKYDWYMSSHKAESETLTKEQREEIKREAKKMRGEL